MIASQLLLLLSPCALSIVLSMMAETRIVSNEASNEVAKLYELMDDKLQNTFFQCYRTYGKISTKKLVASFDDPVVIKSTHDIVRLSRNGIQIPPRPFPQTTSTSKERLFYGISNIDESAEDEDGWELLSATETEEVTYPKWLDDLKIGPGVSPCVNATCGKILRSEEGGLSSKVDCLTLFRELSRTACELCILIKSHRIDVDSIILRAQHNPVKTDAAFD